MHDERQEEGCLRFEHDRRPVDRRVGTIARTVRGELAQHDLPQRRLGPTGLRQQIVGVPESVETTYQVILASPSGMVRSAIDDTTARVFLTRWLSSAVSTFCCSSAAMMLVTSTKVSSTPSISFSVR